MLSWEDSGASERAEIADVVRCIIDRIDNKVFSSLE